MTTTEALAVVREALAYAPFNLSEHISHPAYSALALIEQRVEEAEALPERDKWWEEETAWKARAEKAEAERDEYREKVYELLASIGKDEARISALEAALREIDALDRKGHDSHVAADMGHIARRGA